MKKEKLSILQVTPCFYPAWSYGGIPRVAYDLSRTLIRCGHKVKTLTTDVFSETKRYKKRTDIIDGIETFYFRNLSNSLAYHYQLYLPLGMRKWLSQGLEGIDIVHMNGHRNFLNSIVYEELKAKGIPYVLSAHGTVLNIERRMTLKRVFDYFWGNRIIENAAHFIAVSEKEAEQYLSIGIPSGKISVIYNGIDMEPYGSLPESGTFRKKYGFFDKRIVLYLGKITPRKGLEILVQAIAGIRDRGVVLVVAGNDMGFRTRVEHLIRRLGLTGKVFFVGLLVDSEKLSAYVDADIVVYPSTQEIFGLVPFESIMCGTPVIVTDDCGCGEIISKADAGYIVEYGDVKGLTSKIIEALNNQKDAQAKVIKGRAFIEQNLDWMKISRKITGVYERVCSSGG